MLRLSGMIPPAVMLRRLLGRSLAALAVGTIACPLLASCASETPDPHSPPRACTDIGCVDGLRIELQPGSGHWDKGEYAFEIETPAGKTVCKGSLPLRACEGGPSLHCEGPQVMIGESGCALPAEQHGFSTIELASGPASATIVIARDGTELARKTTAPAYRVSTPNGPGCEPTCRQASDTLRW